LPVTHAGELTSEARARARQMLRKQLRPTDEILDIWFGRLMTEPKPWLRPVPPARRCTPTTLKSRLKAGRSLRWHPATRVAWFGSRHASHLFVDGMHHALPTRLAAFARLLGDSRVMEASALRHHISNPAAASLLLDLIDAGQCTWSR
ncbi:MAG: winged helix domain-containing protein, partial [Gammaproteobacteria bacterium]